MRQCIPPRLHKAYTVKGRDEAQPLPTWRCRVPPSAAVAFRPARPCASIEATLANPRRAMSTRFFLVPRRDQNHSWSVLPRVTHHVVCYRWDATSQESGTPHPFICQFVIIAGKILAKTIWRGKSKTRTDLNPVLFDSTPPLL